jgi:integrase
MIAQLALRRGSVPRPCGLVRIADDGNAAKQARKDVGLGVADEYAVVGLGLEAADRGADPVGRGLHQRRVELAGLMKDGRFRALVLLATFASLRWGEAIALRRCNIDLDGGTVSIRRQYVELSGETRRSRTARSRT